MDSPDSLDNVQEKVRWRQLSLSHLYSSLTPSQWISEVTHFCNGLPIILVACKKDLRQDAKTIQDLARLNQKPVTAQEGQSCKEKIHATAYVECSAKSGDGVREVFQTATRAALAVGVSRAQIQAFLFEVYFC